LTRPLSIAGDADYEHAKGTLRRSPIWLTRTTRLTICKRGITDAEFIEALRPRETASCEIGPGKRQIRDIRAFIDKMRRYYARSTSMAA
jgi:hypothetical protein